MDIGAYGRQSDGSVFANSLFGRMLKAQLPIPPPEPLEGSVSPNLPYVFVGDEAFPLLQNLMRPYLSGNSTREKIVFNYRLTGKAYSGKCSWNFGLSFLFSSSTHADNKTCCSCSNS